MAWNRELLRGSLGAARSGEAWPKQAPDPPVTVARGRPERVAANPPREGGRRVEGGPALPAPKARELRGAQVRQMQGGRGEATKAYALVRCGSRAEVQHRM